MSVVKIPLFAGMVPAMDKHLIDDKNAQLAHNTWLYSGALQGFPEAVKIATLLPDTNFAFRIPLNDEDQMDLTSSFWMQFFDINTDVITAPSAGDSFERHYWTSPSQAPTYNTKARILAGQPPFLLGLPSPGPITVAVTPGVSVDLVTRAYVSTLVTAYGEEGPINEPFLCEEDPEDSTFTVTVAGVLATDMGTDRNVTKIRVYRTIVTEQGTANYYLVKELTALTTTQNFVDTMTDFQLASEPILQSTNWIAPPNLEGWAVMPNGIVIGYLGRDLYFCEPYRPHAWPAAYGITIAFEVVGIGVIGQTAVICTKGNPYTASGVNSFAISTAMLASFEPCLAKGSIVPTEEGVYYMSPNGLILVGPGGAQNITKQFITRDRWNELMGELSANAGRFGAAYVAYNGIISEVFQADAFQHDEVTPTLNAFQSAGGQGPSEGFSVDPGNVNMGFVQLQDDAVVRNVTNDYYSSELFLIREGGVYWHNQKPGFKRVPYLWKSKVFQAPVMTNLSAFKLYFDDDPSYDMLAPQNFDINQVYDPVSQKGVVRCWADGRHILTYEIRTPGELFRIPSGFKADFWEFEFEAIVRIKNFQVATTVKELSNA
jgi:hypothetical protein